MSSLINRFFNRIQLRGIHASTPFFVFSRKALEMNVADYRKYLPSHTEICYSMKSNAEKIVLQTLNEIKTSFEVSSKYELTLLKPLKVPASRIIIGSSVKDGRHIKEFVRYGINRFACDSDPELLKIAVLAPRSKVYIRAHVDDKANSVFHMSEKFGVSIKETIHLLIKAKSLGLVPYGISFNVGSQARNEHAWARGIADLASAITTLQKKGIRIQTINLGGGFPHQYKNPYKTPNIRQIARHINDAQKQLPYSVSFIVEPGRGLVANTYILVVSVIEKIKRHNGHWLHLDAGVYNALLEAMAYQGSIRYHVEPLESYSSIKKESFILTGPSCDDLDVIDKSASLPSVIRVGDKLIVYDTGAYTFALMTRFNGYPKPRVITLN